jgi:PAS domain S-box-containing protein
MILYKDITERKQWEDALRDAKEKWASLTGNTDDIVMVVDGSGVIQYINRTIQPYTPEETVGKTVYEYIPREQRNVLEKSLREVFKTGKPGRYQVSSNIPKIGTIWFSTKVVPVKYDGKVSSAILISSNTTDQKNSEEELRNSEERLSVLFELAPDAYYLNDLRGNFIDGNKTAEEVTGYTKNELIGKSFLKLKLLPRSQALKAAKLLAMNALGKPTGPDEFVLNRKDGTQVSVEIRTYPVKIKGKTVVLGIARDISIRKKDEQAVKESQQKFEGLFRHNPEATVYLDSDFRILDANPRFYQLFGYSAKKVEGKHINEVVAPDDMMEEAERLDKNAKNGYANHDTVRKRKDGSPVHVSISAAPVTIEDKPVGYVGVYKDITNLKDAEEHLRETNERLEVTNEKLHVVGGLTRHDVRNKLVAVTGNAYLLRQKLVGDAKALGQLNEMGAAIRLVEEIFEFARIYEKLGVEQLTSMDVGKAVDGAGSLFSDLKGVKMVNECRGLTVLADSLLSQLFYNLIDNSLKYGEKTQQIKVYYKTSSTNQLELVYEDDGVGIPDNMRSNLFKEGFTSGKGTGYGLFMIKRICEVYGWTIQETGTQGKGARFMLTISEKSQQGKPLYKLP